MESYENYARRGYSYVHNLVANMILKRTTGDPQASISLMESPVPGSVYVSDQFEYVMQSLLPSLLMVMYMPPVYSLVFLIVQEKERGTKETMRIMGMSGLSYWLSWFVYYSLLNTLMTTFALLVVCINCINYSKVIYVWLFFWLYGESVFGQIVFLQSLFSASKYAGIVSTLVYFGSDFFNFAISANGSTRAAKILASILPQVASGQTAVVFAEYEGTGVGIDWSTAGVVYQNYSFDTGLWMMAVSLCVFTALGLYLDAVLPSKYGKRKSPIFCLLPRSYGCCRRKRRTIQQTEDDVLPVADGQDDEFEVANVGAANYEAPPLVCRRQEQYGDYLRIENLQKTFPGGFQAVKGLNVKMYNGQIFALLGHNGAGKTTTISMLTGLITKSEGRATVFDTDCFEEMSEVREFMGVCP